MVRDKCEVGTICVSKWDHGASVVVQRVSLTHPLTRMVLTSMRMVLSNGR